jgi:hypothetical protein
MGYIGNAPYNGVITGDSIQDGTVDTADITNDAVTTVKIADGAVTAAKLASGAAVPSQSGQSGKYLTTDGTNSSWGTVNTDLVSDTSPQLGGNLDLNGYQITGTGGLSMLLNDGTNNVGVSITTDNADGGRAHIILDSDASDGIGVGSDYVYIATDSSKFLGNVTATGNIKGTLKGITKFTSSGTYTVPSDVGTVKVYVTGGGGGGGAHNTDDAQGGGGAGGTAIKVIDLSSVSSVYCTIGAAGSGAGGNTSGGAGSGGASSFGAYCSASGGAGVPTWGKGGRGGVGSGGDLNLYGSDGHTGNIDGSGNSESGGNGGDSFWSGAGTGGTHWGQREAPRGWGCGGSGSHASTNNTGTAGVTGVVVIEEYYK